MKFLLCAAAAAELKMLRLLPVLPLLVLLLATTSSSCEAKLGSPPPPPSSFDHDDSQGLFPPDVEESAVIATTIATTSTKERNLGLTPSSCIEYPHEFRYETDTNGTPLTSCFKMAVQASRGAISSRQMVNRCKKRIVAGLDGRYGAGATIADACPLICGAPCDAGDGGATQDVSNSNAEQAERLPEPENNSDEDIAVVLLPEEEEGNDEAETVFPTVVAGPTIQEQVEEAGTVVEEKPTPTIASFEPIQKGKGQWGDEFDMELIPIHTMLLPDGQILSYGTSAKGRQGADLYYEVWDWNNGIHGKVHKLLKHKTEADIFCSSLNVDPSNGNIIIMGGDVRSPNAGYGIETVLEYDVKDESVRKHPKGNMHYARWYGTSVNLPDGDIFVVGGRDDDKKGSPIPEVYSADSGFRTLKGASVPAIAKEKSKNHWWYPHTFVNSKGDIIVIMPRKDNADVYRIGVEGNGSIKRIGRKPFEAHVRSPSIMFRTDQVAFLDDKGSLWVADISSSSAVKWDKRNNIGHGRTNGSMAILPDGRVAIVGGARSTDDGGSKLSKAEHSIHIWDADTNKLTRGASEKNARLYHSSALVLQDGSLVSAGGGAPGPVKNRNGQLYHPDYFYNTKQEKTPRPKIIACPRNINSGETFLITVDDASRVVKVTTTKSGASSHTRNSDTRWLDLKFDVLNDTILKVHAEERNIMIGGLWMLNTIDVNGIPSEASLMGVDMAPL